MDREVMVAQHGDVCQGTAPLRPFGTVPRVPSSLVGTLLEVGFKRAEAKQCQPSPKTLVASVRVSPSSTTGQRLSGPLHPLSLINGKLMPNWSHSHQQKARGSLP